MRRDQDMDSWRYEEENAVGMFGSDEDAGTQIPTQIQSLVEGSGTVMVSEYKPVLDVDYLQVCNLSVLFLWFLVIEITIDHLLMLLDANLMPYVNVIITSIW